jgi:DNA polymerase-3 subunit epsilon
MTTLHGAPSAEAAPSADARGPDIRILRRVSLLADFPLAEPGDGAIRRIAIVDTETTGIDPDRDEVIDVAVVVVEVDAAGAIVGIASAGQALRDPGMPIPAAITRLTGLTDEDVAGKVIDLDRLELLLLDADVRVAHNAQFDIAFLESLMPGLAGAAWACSATDFDWAGAG